MICDAVHQNDLMVINSWAITTATLLPSHTDNSYFEQENHEMSSLKSQIDYDGTVLSYYLFLQ